MTTLITVAGTHGERNEEAWFRWGSDWWNEAERRGAKRADVDRKRWSGKVDGIFGENETWREGGLRLRDYILAAASSDIGEVVLVAHSHGGHVVGEALWGPISGFEAVITLGTPVRKDVEHHYAGISKRTFEWTHIYSHSDWWQLLGGIGDGHFSLLRRMKHAHRNIRAKGLGHADLHSVKAWDENNWWDLIFGEGKDG